MADDCPICANELEQDVFKLKACSHLFHKECITQWVRTCNNNFKTPKCPLCRAIISDKLELPPPVVPKEKDNRPFIEPASSSSGPNAAVLMDLFRNVYPESISHSKFGKTLQFSNF
jgi:hypothetical protein